MKILFDKPKFDHPLKAVAIAWLNNAKTAKLEPTTFKDIRIDLGKSEIDLPDGVIHQIAVDLGLEVIPE